MRRRDPCASAQAKFKNICAGYPGYVCEQKVTKTRCAKCAVKVRKKPATRRPNPSGKDRWPMMYPRRHRLMDVHGWPAGIYWDGGPGNSKKNTNENSGNGL